MPNIHRKPVAQIVEGGQAATPSPATPPRYILEVAPPPPPMLEVAPPPQYIERGLPPAASTDSLPTYAVETQTEPHTLARACWRWGFLFPLLWLIGMLILWIPLRPVEEEPDGQKAQKLEEMIVILRKAELKYARRCAWCFAAFCVVLAAIIIIAVVATR